MMHGNNNINTYLGACCQQINEVDEEGLMALLLPVDKDP